MSRASENFRGCRRECKKCVPKHEQCKWNRPWSCPTFPVIKQFHQGVIMSGDGGPPNSLCDDVVDFPDPKCFLYRQWYDFKNDVYHVLTNDLKGKPVAYDRFVDGSQFLLLSKITNPSNPGVLGAVLTSETIFALQRCVNVDAVRLAPTATRNALNQTSKVLNCAIAKANKGSIGFIYGNPPYPFILDQLNANSGYTLTPDYWLVPGKLPDDTLANGFFDFGWIVFVRDKRNNRYYRDTFNSPTNDPDFPPNAIDMKRPCNGDLYIVDIFGMIYEFDVETCRWYLFDATDEVKDVLSDINQGLDPVGGTCAIEDNWERNCNCDCEPKDACADCDCGCDCGCGGKKGKKGKKGGCGCGGKKKHGEHADDGDHAPVKIVKAQQ